MAQRDKVKELVGRGLHSYHTKALQQIDRIEKKNKEQNDKISILSMVYPPTSTVTYAGEAPIVKSVRLNKTEVLNNTEDINDNIIPYLMDMDYRVVMLQLATEELEGGVSMARLFGGTYEMIKRDILSKRLTREEYGYRLADYYNAGKLTEEQVRELEELR